MRAPAECVHLESEFAWMAALAPDDLYLRGKRARRHSSNGAAARPEVSLCRQCLLDVLEPELASYRGRMVAFEPDEEAFSQYFFVARADFEAAGLRPEVQGAIEKRLAESGHGECQSLGAACSRPAKWLWLSRQEVADLDEAEAISSAPGRWLCATHGAEKLCRWFAGIEEANVLYINVPYGEAGAYLWI